MTTLKVPDNFLLPGLHTAVAHQPDGSCAAMLWVPNLTEEQARKQQQKFDAWVKLVHAGANMRVIKDGEDQG